METAVLLVERQGQEKIEKSSNDDLKKNYRRAIEIEMKKLGASAKEMSLLKDATVENGYKYGRSPEDVAWAILQ